VSPTADKHLPFRHLQAGDALTGQEISGRGGSAAWHGTARYLAGESVSASRDKGNVTKTFKPQGPITLAFPTALRAHHRFNSPSRARTCDLAVNSRSLYQLSYRGIYPKAGPSCALRTSVIVSVKVNQISTTLSRFIWGCRYRKTSQRWTETGPGIKLGGLRILCRVSFIWSTTAGRWFRSRDGESAGESEEHEGAAAHLHGP
jgi:hypothetical protein